MFLNRRLNKKIDNKSFLNGVNREISSLITQINETSDRNVMLIENRLDRLTKILGEADIKINQIRAMSLAKINTEGYEKENSINNQKIFNEVKIEPIEAPQTQKNMEDDPTLSRRERILLLYKQGISPTIIASQTKATIGEVELIISLSRG